MEVNPYAPPDDSSELASSEGNYRVEGEFLVVTGNAVLPPRCVFTNSPVDDLNVVVRQFKWAPSFQLVLAYKRASVRLRRDRKRVRRQGVVQLCMILVVAAVTYWVEIPGKLMLFVFAIGIVGRFCRVDTLSLKRYSHGEFWIAGCGTDFLESLRQEAIE